MSNLGGHDLETLLEAFARGRQARPARLFIAYTIKGFGLPIAGHKDNHAGLMKPAQIAGLRVPMGIRQGHEWEPFEGLGATASELGEFLAGTAARSEAFARLRKRRASRPPPASPMPKQPSMSTQAGFRALLHDIAKREDRLGGADRHHLARCDGVDQPWRLGEPARAVLRGGINRGPFPQPNIASAHNWSMRPRGQHFELGIAEINLFCMLSAMGLADDLFGERLLPIGTLYDPFIARGLDALNYACYQDARFLLVATPSGVTLAPEGGAHQSIDPPLIGMAQDGLTSFEPAFADELAVILRWGFEHIQAPPRDTTADRFT